MGHGPSGGKWSDVTERLHFHFLVRLYLRPSSYPSNSGAVGRMAGPPCNLERRNRVSHRSPCLAGPGPAALCWEEVSSDTHNDVQAPGVTQTR